MDGALRRSREAAQRLRLLDGLAESIREKGLGETQVNDVVRHAATSKRTFYKHFVDKDACFVELARLLSDEVHATVVAAIDPTADWERQVSAAISAYLESLASDPALTLTFSSTTLGPTVVRAQRDAMEQYAAMVVAISAGPAFHDAGVEPISFERAYMLVCGLGMTVMRAAEHGDDIVALAPDLIAVFEAALRHGPVPTHSRR